MLEDRLDYFVLAYDSTNFSAAAAQIPMSPQGFTKVIHNLERDLNVSLFETDEHGVRHPTRYADELYKYAKNVQAERRMLEKAFSVIDKEGKTEINVACAVGIPGLVGVDNLTNYHGESNNVYVSFTELPDSLCDSLVKEGQFDVGLTLQPADPALETKNLFSTSFLMWVKRGDPLSEKDVLKISDIADRTIAIPGKDFRCYQSLVNCMKQNGVDNPDIVEYAEVFWIYQFVKSGKGIGFSLPHLAALDIFTDDEDMVAIPLESLNWQMCFAWPKTRELTQYEEAFLDYLKTICNRLKRKWPHRYNRY